MKPGSEAPALEKNNFIYEALQSRLERKLAEGPEAALHQVERIAEFALNHHPGRFADGAVENVAFRVGRSIEDGSGPAPALESRIRRDPRPKVLLVANRVHSIGGHTRLIGKCVATDPSAVHVLVLTDQQLEIPPLLEEIVARAGGQIIRLSTADSRVERARQLRAIARTCDRVFLVTYPQDPIPVAAFAADGLPPVAMSNHAHFSFCLGSTVADMIVNHIPYHLELVTRPFRFARSADMLLFFPGLAPFEPVDKRAAKRALGFSEHDVVLLAMAFPNYWVPNREYDFFRTARRILELDPRVHIVMVGIDPADPNCGQRVPDSPRMHLHGPILDPAPYYRAADATLESFPIPSPGSVVEAVAYGAAYPILKYGRGESILCFDLPVLSSMVERARDEEGYLAQVKAFLDAGPEHRRRADVMREALIAFDGSWAPRLQAMYAKLDGLGHQPREIPAAPCSRTPDSRLLAEINFGPWARPATLPAYIMAPDFTPAECWHYFQLAAAKGCLRPEDVAGAVAELVTGHTSLTAELRHLRDQTADLQASIQSVGRSLQDRSSHALELEQLLRVSHEMLAAQQARIEEMEARLQQQQVLLEGQSAMLRAQHESIALQGTRLDRIERFWAVRLYRRLKSGLR